MKTTKNIPELRFPGFVGEWEMSRFGDRIYRGTEKYNPERDHQELPCIELESLSQDTGILLQTFNSQKLKSIKNKFHKGDILFGKLRPYLRKFYRASFNGVCSSEIWVLKGHTTYSDFIYYLIQTEKFNYEVNLTVGSKMPRAEWSYISEIDFSFPLLPEQQKIASFLSSVDQRIQLLTRKKEQLEQYKKGVMQQIFSRQLRFKDEQGKEFPNWEETQFGSLYQFLSTNSLSREKLNYEFGTIKNIHYGDIHTKFKSHFIIDNELVPYIKPEIDLSKINADNFLKEGDLIIADASEDYADIGKSIEIYQLNNQAVLAGLHTILARRKHQKVLIGFGGLMMKSFEVRNQIQRIAQGTKVLSISANRLSELKILLPSKPEQQKIATFLSSVDDKITHVNTQIEQTRKWKQGLLQKMFV